MIPPNTITILTDGNVLELVGTTKIKDGLLYQYKYSKSISKKGLTLEMDEKTLEKLISTNQ